MQEANEISTELNKIKKQTNEKFSNNEELKKIISDLEENIAFIRNHEQEPMGYESLISLVELGDEILDSLEQKIMLQNRNIAALLKVSFKKIKNYYAKFLPKEKPNFSHDPPPKMSMSGFTAGRDIQATQTYNDHRSHINAFNQSAVTYGANSPAIAIPQSRKEPSEKLSKPETYSSLKGVNFMKPAAIMSNDLNKGTFPTPYEQALLSRLAYYEVSKLSDKNEPDEFKYYQYLKNIGWELKKTVSENDYYGYIWVNETTRQIGIAHRGSQNATSWITDAESVVQSKPGTFIYAAIKLLSDPIVLESRKQGYRLFSTGHSLGGFLAQVCVFWSHRREFKETYYPDMSANVFDSPGAVDFFNVIISNLKTEQESIKLGALNIHNFCSMPTIVSTYGTHTGTIWHLPRPEGVKFEFVNDHKMVNILSGFYAVTGYPKDFRQMTDWPQANYSEYDSFTGTIEHLAIEGIKAPFTFLNLLYKHMIKHNHTDTWYDKLFRQQGEVSTFLRNADYRPTAESLQEKLTLAITSHYTFLNEKDSINRLNICHFDNDVQEFLSDLSGAKRYGLNNIGLEKQLVQYFGEEGFKLLSQFDLQVNGNRAEVVLKPEYAGTIFTFQNSLQLLLKNKSIPKIPELIGQTANQFNAKVNKIEDKQSEDAKKIQQAITDLGNIKGNIIKGRVQINRGAATFAPDAPAINMLDEEAYKPERLDELKFMLSQMKPGDVYMQDTAATFAAGSPAINMPKNPNPAQMNALAGIQMMFGKKPAAQSGRAQPINTPQPERVNFSPTPGSGSH